ncbi:hypothetical protein CDD83_10718 [Cordyceps sp. RAO-2017]|nr:hypothetical protein CDD83_10718 [Cordyceps sp. RAO-2017]
MLLHAVDPEPYVFLLDASIQGLVHISSLVEGHDQGIIDLFGHSGYVPGVYMQRILQIARRAAELGDDQLPVGIPLTGDELQTSGARSLSRTGDQRHVAKAQQGKVLLAGQVV